PETSGEGRLSLDQPARAVEVTTRPPANRADRHPKRRYVMTLPGKQEKGYLQIVGAPRRPTIEGESRHIAELEAIFTQHGIACGRGPAVTEGWEALELRDSDVAQATQLLDAYKTAKGS